MFTDFVQLFEEDVITPPLRKPLGPTEVPVHDPQLFLYFSCIPAPHKGLAMLTLAP